MIGTRTMKTAIAAAALGVLTVAGSAQAELVYGLTTDNNIFTFDSANPAVIQSGKFITGLQANEIVVAMDLRPANGQIYAVGSSNTLYTLNPTTGAATSVAAISTSLNGTTFDIDFNPVADAIRLISNTGQNLSISPTTGVATVQTNINASYANPVVAGAAYTNNFAGATSTSLYTLDSRIDFLNTQNPPANGTQVQVASIKDNTNAAFDATSLLGFDISGTTGLAYVVVQQGANGYSQFSTLNLATGVLNNITASNNTTGLIGGGSFVRDLTVAIPEPASLGLVGAAFLGLAARRRRG